MIKIEEINKLKKQRKGLLIMCLILWIAVIFLAVFSHQMEKNYNSAADKFNDCTRDCMQFVRQSADYITGEIDCTKTICVNISGIGGR